MAEDAAAAVVIDNGSGLIKAGFAGEDEPQAVFPTVVGRPQNQIAAAACANRRDSFVGEDAQSNRSLLSLQRPIQRGLITNWDDMEKVWEHVYSKLGVVPKDHSAFMITTPLCPDDSKGKMAEILLEKFQVPSFYVGVQAVLSLYSSGRTSGLVVDSGYGVTHAVPVLDGVAFDPAIRRLDLGGCDLTQYLLQLLQAQGHPSLVSAHLDTARDVKEKLCHVAQDYQKELDKKGATEGKTYALPDGKTVKVGDVSFRCPEALFQPALLGKPSLGVHELTRDAVEGCQEEARALLLANIVLAGGSAQFPGLEDRLGKELTFLFPEALEIAVDAPSDMPVSAWFGGAILASLPSFRSMWISRQDFAEQGPGVINKKCL